MAEVFGFAKKVFKIDSQARTPNQTKSIKFGNFLPVTLK